MANNPVIDLGKTWVALHRGRVVSFVSMRRQLDSVTLRRFCVLVNQCLQRLGHVSTADLYFRQGDHAFFVDIDQEGDVQEVVVRYVWAAIESNGERSIASIVPMQVPNFVNYNAHRERVKEFLSMIGHPKPGMLVERGDQIFFKARKNHSRRSKRALDEVETVYRLPFIRYQ